MEAGHGGGQSNQGERHDARPGQEAYAWNDADTAQGLIYPAIPPMRQWGARQSVAVLCQVAGAK